MAGSIPVSFLFKYTGLDLASCCCFSFFVLLPGNAKQLSVPFSQPVQLRLWWLSSQGWWNLSQRAIPTPLFVPLSTVQEIFVFTGDFCLFLPELWIVEWTRRRDDSNMTGHKGSVRRCLQLCGDEQDRQRRMWNPTLLNWPIRRTEKNHDMQWCWIIRDNVARSGGDWDNSRYCSVWSNWQHLGQN